MKAEYVFELLRLYVCAGLAVSALFGFALTSILVVQVVQVIGGR